MNAVDLTTLSPTLLCALQAVAAERQRQDGRWGRGGFPAGGLGFGPAAIGALDALLVTIQEGDTAAAEQVAKEACNEAMARGEETAADVLLEELAEVFHALLGERGGARVRVELEQLAAVAVKLVEALDPTRDRLEDRRLRVYVAAPRGEAYVAALLGEQLIHAGFTLVSRWVERFHAQGDHVTREQLAAIHRANQAELASADLVVAWTAEGEPKATYGEIGQALALGTRVLWIQGPGGAGGNSYDTERLVRVVELDPKARAGAGWEAILAACREMEREIRAARADVPVVAEGAGLDGVTAPAPAAVDRDVPAWLLAAAFEALPTDGSPVRLSQVDSKIDRPASDYTLNHLLAALAALVASGRAYRDDGTWCRGVPDGFAWSRAGTGTLYLHPTLHADDDNRVVSALAVVELENGLPDWKLTGGAWDHCDSEEQGQRLAVRECWKLGRFRPHAAAPAPAIPPHLAAVVDKIRRSSAYWAPEHRRSKLLPYLEEHGHPLYEALHALPEAEQFSCGLDLVQPTGGA